MNNPPPDPFLSNPHISRPNSETLNTVPAPPLVTGAGACVVPHHLQGCPPNYDRPAVAFEACLGVSPDGRDTCCLAKGHTGCCVGQGVEWNPDYRPVPRREHWEVPPADHGPCQKFGKALDEEQEALGLPPRREHWADSGPSGKEGPVGVAGVREIASGYLPNGEKSPNYDEIVAMCEEIRDLLLVKNAAYGDSALRPLRCFSKLDSLAGIRVRMDDKLSRIMRGTTDNEDTSLDLIGYLVLERIALRKQAQNTGEY